jgi:glutathione S-transferase
MNMKLRWAPGSPFVRKVMVTAIETGQEDAIEKIATDYHAPNSDIVDQNPLGKVPALILDDGSILVDSPVICAYLDSLHEGPRMIPEDAKERWAALSLEGLADGMTESAIAVQRERGRPEDKRWDQFRDRQWGKFERTMDWLEANPKLFEKPVNIGQIAVACGIGWIEFRMGDVLGEWRRRWPRLGAWHDEFSRRPSMRATMPH